MVFDPIHPTGLYVKDPGRAVHYYRAGSAAAHLSPADVDLLDWSGVRVLHTTGITAALSSSAANFVDRAFESARAHGALVSFDVNHRTALWRDPRADTALAALAGRADIVFVGRDEAAALWGTETPESVRALFPDVPELVVKDADVGATAFTGPEEIFVPALVVDVIESVGAGDAFAGGYLAGLLANLGIEQRLALGHERAALTLRTTDDFPDAASGH